MLAINWQRGLLPDTEDRINLPAIEYLLNTRVNCSVNTAMTWAGTFAIRGVYVFDKQANDYTELQIEIPLNVLVGYWAVNGLPVDPVTDRIRTENYRIEYSAASDYDLIENLLTPPEKELINPDEVAEIKLKGNKYYQLRELEDGDFIGIDLQKNVYVITHDPFEINKQSLSLEEVLKINT